MIEVHQIAREADDFVLEKLESLADVQFVMASPSRRTSSRPALSMASIFCCKPARAGRVPYHGHDLHDLPAGIDHRAGDQFHELLVFDIQCVAFGSAEGGGVGGCGLTCLLKMSNAS